MNKRFYVLMVAVFVALSALLYILGDHEAITQQVLLIGNAVILLLSILSYAISSRFANSDSNSQFVRGVMGGTFLKFFLAIVFGLVYIIVNKDNIKIADIIALMVLYIIYTAIETITLAKSSRKAS